MSLSTSLASGTNKPTAAEYEFINHYYEEYRHTLGGGGGDVWKLVNTIFPRFQSRFKRTQVSDPMDFRPYAVWRLREFEYIRNLLHAAANIRMRSDSVSKPATITRTEPLMKTKPTGARPATTSNARATGEVPTPSPTASAAQQPSFPVQGRATLVHTRVPPAKKLPPVPIEPSVRMEARTLHRSENRPGSSPEVPPAPPPSAEPTPERERSVQPTASTRPRRTTTLLPTLKPRPPPSLLFSTPPRHLPTDKEIDDEMNQFDMEMQETDEELMDVSRWVSETTSNGSLPKASMSSASSIVDPSPTLAASSSRQIRHLRKEEDPTPPRRSPRLLNIPPINLPLPGRRPNTHRCDR